MMSLLLFTGIVLLLILQGSGIAYAILKTTNRLLVLSLGLPIAALTNVLIVFLWTVAGVPLTPLSLILPSAIITFLLFPIEKKIIATPMMTVQESSSPTAEKLLQTLCIALLSVTVIYSFAHAVLLPTFQYDSATNWTMRSEISFFDRSIAFDKDEIRGMAKPQYPFLFHALQITVNQGQGLGVAQSVAGWNDTAANAILWLLSFSCFSALFLILRTILKRSHALLTLTMILGIPLLSLHLGQGYADIVLLQQLLLSLACLIVWNRNNESKWLLLSGIFAASTVWTKSEGLIFGLIPWIVAVIAIALMHREKTKESLRACGLAVALSIPWPLFALSKGLLLTPHGSDMTIAFHPEGLSEAFLGLIDRGSFGIAWYVLVVAIPWMIIGILKSWKRDRKELPPLAWGIAIFVEVLFVYLFTPNVQFLLNAESYYRQMMIPAAMLMLSICAWFGKEDQRNHSKIA